MPELPLGILNYVFAWALLTAFCAVRLQGGRWRGMGLVLAGTVLGLVAGLSDRAGLLIAALSGALGGPVVAAATLGFGVLSRVLGTGEGLGGPLALAAVSALGLATSFFLKRRGPSLLLLAGLGLVATLFAARWDILGFFSLVAAPLISVAVGLFCRYQKRREREKERLVRQATELSEREKSARDVLDHLPEAVFLYDLDGYIVDVNKRFMTLYELDRREQAVGTSPLDYAAPDTKPDLALDPRSEPTPGSTLTFEWQCRGLQSGRRFPAEVQLTRVDYHGAPHLLAVVRDRSREKTAEQQRKSYQLQLESLLSSRTAELSRASDRVALTTEAVPTGFWEWDLATDALECDDALLEIYGLARQEFTGLLADLEQRLVPQDLPLWKAMVARCGESDEVLVCQYRIVRGDGEVRRLRCRGRAIRSPEGTALRLVGSTSDVTERGGAVDRSETVQSVFRSYLDAIEVMLVALDADGTITLLNRKGYQILGYPTGSLEGRNWFLTCLPPEQVARVQTLHRQSLDGSAGIAQYHEHEVLTRSGDSRLVAWHYAPVRDPDGRLVGTISSGEDITEKRAAERQLVIYSGHLEELVTKRTRELEGARDAANAANEAKSLFLANMSHEIRTPMNSVLGFAQLLAQESGLSTEGRHKVETIVRSGEQLLAIINDILEMSRIEAGRLEIRPRPTDLHSLLSEVNQQFGQKAGEKGLQWTLHRAENVPQHVVTDPVRLRQILTNLIGNAIKFTDAGSVSVSSSAPGPARLVIEVSDTGVGIPVSERSRLFQPFERTRSGKAVAGGTGLGLAISRRYAQLLGGDVNLVDGQPRGALFRVEIDAPMASGSTENEFPTLELPALSPQHRGTRVLVVDDLKPNRDLLKGLLEPLGFVVIEAIDGNEAVHLVDSRAPRLVLMDLLMPGLDGDEATRRIRDAHPRELVTIIGITASAFEEERKRFEASGLDGFLAKPFRFAELHHLIAELTDLQFEPGLSTPLPEEGLTAADLPPEWTEAFRVALSQGNVTRLRQLGEEARSFDPGLAGWVAERAARYELDELRGFLNSRGGAQ